MWIICVIYVLCLSCFRVCLLLPCGHLLGKGWPLGSCLICLIVILSLFHVVSGSGVVGWLVGFVALRPKSTAKVMAGRSVHITTLFPGQA